ncbi:hypothetical protein ACN28S_21820 [Cystobacter fuscus]
MLYASLFHQPCLGAPSTLSGSPWTGSAFDTSRTETLVELPEDTARYLQQVGSEVALSPRFPKALPHRAPPRLPPATARRSAGRLEGRGHVAGDALALPLGAGDGARAPVALGGVRETRLTGQVRILFPRDAPLEEDVAPQVEGEELVFSLHDARILGATLHFRAVSTEDGLRGVVHAQDAQGGRWFGSWSASPSTPA